MFAKAIAQDAIKKMTDAMTAFGVALVSIFLLGMMWWLNTGFSIAGVAAILAAFGEWGNKFWAMLSANRAEFYGQPILLVPFAICIGISCLQIRVIYDAVMKIRTWGGLRILALLLSIGDFSTTVYGITQMEWAKPYGLLPAILLGIIMTFSFEIVVSFILKHLSK